MARPGLTKHPKFRRLMHELKISRALTWGLLECLWEPAYESGEPHIGDAVDVELAASWEGEAGALVKALLNAGSKGRAGFIEEDPAGSEQYRIHHLFENAPEYVQQRGAREAERQKVKTCEQCQRSFNSSDPKAKFCSGSCRVTHFREGKRSGTETDVTKRNDGGRYSETDVTKCNDTPAPARRAHPHAERTHSAPARIALPHAPLSSGGGTGETPPATAESASSTRGARAAKPKAAIVDEATMLTIYAAYPRKKAKPDALRAIVKALTALQRRGSPPAPHPTWARWLQSRVTAFARHRQSEIAAGRTQARFTPYPASWFNDEGYDEAIEETDQEAYEETEAQMRERHRALGTSERHIERMLIAGRRLDAGEDREVVLQWQLDEAAKEKAELEAAKQ